MSELLPCPHCGGKWALGQEPHDNASVASMWYLYHKNPRCRMDHPTYHFASRDELIAAWNTRTQSPEAIRAAALEEAVAKRMRDEDGSSYTSGFNNGLQAALVAIRALIQPSSERIGE